MANYKHSYTGLASLDIVGVRVKALQQLLAYLVHSFPRVNTNKSYYKQIFNSLLDSY